MKSRLGQKVTVALCAIFMMLMTPLGVLAETSVIPEDGLYTIAVESSSNMFRVVKCVLRVDGGEITATLTMSGTGYGYLFQGTPEQADAVSVEAWSPFKEDLEGRYAFAIQIPALDTDIDVASWSIKYEKWYDRTLRFLSESLQTYAAIPADGDYLIETVSDSPLLNGGQCRLTVVNGEMTAQSLATNDALAIAIPSLDMYLSDIPGSDNRVLFDSYSLRP